MNSKVMGEIISLRNSWCQTVMLGTRKRKELKMTQRFLAWTSGGLLVQSQLLLKGVGRSS